VGFLLVGSAFGAVVRGPIVRKVLWLLGGMLLLWSINLSRIVFIFWAGKMWGEDVAINILHPFVGMIGFALGVTGMILLIRPLGMHIGIAEKPSAVARPHSGSSKVSLAVPKVFMAIVVVTVVAFLIGVDNLGLRTFNLVADA